VQKHRFLHFSPPLERAFAHFTQKSDVFFAHFTDGNSSVKKLKNFFKSAKLHKSVILHFYLAFVLVNFIFWPKMEMTFSKESRSLCSTPFLLFDQKVLFGLISSLKCREMSDHCHGFGKCFLAKKYFIWPLHAVFKKCTFAFLKRGGTKMVHDFCAKSTKAKKCEKPTSHVASLVGKSTHGKVHLCLWKNVASALARAL